jgi:hypothetical protein
LSGPTGLIPEKRKQEYAKNCNRARNFAANNRSKALRKLKMRLAAPDEIVRKKCQTSPDVRQRILP